MRALTRETRRGAASSRGAGGSVQPWRGHYLLMPETEPMYARDGLDDEVALESLREAGRGQPSASVIGIAAVDVGLPREASAERSSHCAHRRLPGMRMHI